MQGIQRPHGEVSSMVRAANRMARKYGQIGNCLPEDIAQEAMIKLLKRKGDREPTIGWLYKTVRSAAYDAGRRHQREAQHCCSFIDTEQFRGVCELADDDGYVFTGGTYLPQREEEHDPDLLPRLKEMLLQLTEPLRDVLVLYADGLTYEQIAERTRTKIGTVRSRIHYARKRARLLMGDLT